MKLQTYSSEGIVLSRRNHSEADRLLTVFTKDKGKLVLLAKGVRKPKSRKRGHIEIFSHIRFSVAKGHAWDIVTEVESLNNFEELRKDLKRVTVGYYFMDVLNRTINEGEDNDKLFNLTLEYMTRLKDTKNIKSLRLNFLLKLLTTLGFWPAGKAMSDPDSILSEILERQINSARVGKKLLE